MDTPSDTPVASTSAVKSDRKAMAASIDIPAPTKSKKAAEMDEFMKTMKPKTKKGPAWANDEPLAAQAAVETAPKQPEPSSEEDGGDASVHSNRAGVSDLDWMRQRMSGTVDKAGKVYDQSDEELEEVEAIAVLPDVRSIPSFQRYPDSLLNREERTYQRSSTLCSKPSSRPPVSSSATLLSHVLKTNYGNCSSLSVNYLR
jgi:multiple RNA-binding domain-containing protein 1